MIILGGKGGTGKTTCSAATAIHLARAHPKKKILVISTDPAHSLGDSFGCPIGTQKPLIEGFSNLWAMEMDPRRDLEDFKYKHKRELDKLLHRSGFYGQISLNKFLSFSLPGMAEMMTFLHIADMLFKSSRLHSKRSAWIDSTQEADLVILDTAPSGHTLRLLSLPQRTKDWVNVLDTSLNRYRTSPRLPLVGFKGSVPKAGGDATDRFVGWLKADLEKMSSLLTNGEECEFVPVMLPEPMSVEETHDLISALEERNISVRNIIINRIRKMRECPFCGPKGKEDEAAVVEIEKEFANYNLIQVPVFPYEIRKAETLTTYAEVLSGNSHPCLETRPTGSKQKPIASISPISDLLEKKPTVILFGGKGGVGKTSIAAATALRAARQYPQKKILIFSLDPAHSIADSFDVPITEDTVTAIPGVNNLYALETDAAKLRQHFIDQISALITSAFAVWEERLRSLVLKWDKQVMEAFAQTSPVGLDELLALEKIMGFVEEKKYDVYVLDTAPTGHLLDLLEFPELVRDWLRHHYVNLLRWNRDIPLTEITDLGNLILRSTTNLRKIRELISDQHKSKLVVITIPEAMGVAETRRLLTSLKRLEIPCQHILINMIVPPTDCNFCVSKMQEQMKYITQVKDLDPSHYLITEIMLLPHEMSGIDDLTELSEIMYGTVRLQQRRS